MSTKVSHEGDNSMCPLNVMVCVICEHDCLHVH